MSKDHVKSPRSKTLVKFINGVIHKDNVACFKYCTKTWKAHNGKPALKRLIEFGISDYSIEKEKMITEFHYEVRGVMQINSLPYLFKCNMLQESEPYKTGNNGSWGVNPPSFMVSKIAGNEEIQPGR